uniref:Uncharacterized protein n=1 Tax=Spongospora subterranea TaxID=70186 RepID=A0A0H5RSP5_9EUKA|eukprot:CRZ11764.1 hypothetical protein [Spongospora subterranea]
MASNNLIEANGASSLGRTIQNVSDISHKVVKANDYQIIFGDLSTAAFDDQGVLHSVLCLLKITQEKTQKPQSAKTNADWGEVRLVNGRINVNLICSHTKNTKSTAAGQWLLAT